MGQVTLSTDEYHDLINQRQIAENEAAAARKELAVARGTDQTGRLTKIIDGFKSALEVVSFAVGNLPAESYKGWPFDALYRVANAVLEMPECGPNERDLAGEYGKFAGECATHEARRALAKSKPTGLTVPKHFDIEPAEDDGTPG